MSTERPSSPPAKRPKTDSSSQHEVFVANLPFDATEAGLQVAIKRIFAKVPGGVQTARFHLKKGLAWVCFTSEAAVDAALAVDAELGRRRLRIQRSRPFGAEAKEEKKLPYAECWYCLGSSQCDPEFIATCTLQTYSTLARGGITGRHLVLSSVEHIDCFSAASEAVQTELRTQLDSLEAQLGPAVWFERWTPFKYEEANHLQINFIPYEKERKLQMLDLDDPLFAPYNVELVADLAAVVATTTAGQTPHFWVRFEQTFLVITSKNKDTLPKDLGREIVCRLLDCGDRLDWRTCVRDKADALAVVGELRQILNSSSD